METMMQETAFTNIAYKDVQVVCQIIYKTMKILKSIYLNVRFDKVSKVQLHWNGVSQFPTLKQMQPNSNHNKSGLIRNS